MAWSTSRGMSLAHPSSRMLFATIAGLLLLSTVAELFTPRFGSGFFAKLFSVNREGNIPTLFSTFQLLVASGLLAVISRDPRLRRTSSVWPWYGLSAGFLFLAGDEYLQLHERLSHLPFERIDPRLKTGIFTFSWVVVAIPCVLGLVALYGRFLTQLPAPSRRRFLTAGALFLGGAVGFELIGAALYSASEVRSAYLLCFTIEEGLEMAGVTWFLRALLLHGEDAGWRLQLTQLPSPEVTPPSHPPQIAALSRD